MATASRSIFYQRSDVLTVSIHGHPRFAYPYFSGFEDEIGEAEGTGYNMNLPLAEQLTSDQYLAALAKALKAHRQVQAGLPGGLCWLRHRQGRSDRHLELDG